MPDRWDEYVHRQNVERYRRLLSEAKDERTREFLRALLAEEDASARTHNWPPWDAVPPAAGGAQSASHEKSPLDR